MPLLCKAELPVPQRAGAHIIDADVANSHLTASTKAEAVQSIGLLTGSHRLTEIAVAIVAEMTAVKAGCGREMDW